MPDPLSSVVSVITLLGTAAESVGVLVTFFREFHNAPAEVHEWLTMLEALTLTLSNLEQCGQNLNSRYQFSSKFHQRLLLCVKQLQVCLSEAARVDASLNKADRNSERKWTHRARRSWAKAKWATVRDQKTKKIMKSVQLYHFEFGMELLKMLM